MLSYEVSSCDDAAHSTFGAAVEFNEVILLLIGRGLRGIGEGKRVNGGEEGVDGRKYIHFDRVYCARRRFEESCVAKVIELFVKKSAVFPFNLYTLLTENYSVYTALGVKELEWRLG